MNDARRASRSDEDTVWAEGWSRGFAAAERLAERRRAESHEWRYGYIAGWVSAIFGFVIARMVLG